MSWAVDDHLFKITHIIRGNDLMIESDIEKYICHIFKWNKPEIIHTGIVSIEGVKISKSKAREEVKSGKYFGWEDPRTWSIQSLAKRGIKAKAIREFVKEIGLNKQDITVPIEGLYAINRKIIDAESQRYSFVINPIKLNIKKAPKIETVEVPIHPDKEEKRIVNVGDIYISKEDYKKLEGKEIRLLHLFNIVLKEESKFTSSENKDIPKINWVSDFVNASVLMPDGFSIKGIADSDIAKLKKEEMIQFERQFFCRFEGEEEGVYKFWFAHR